MSILPILGVDPGQSGALALLRPTDDGGYVLDVWDMPTVLAGARKTKRKVDPEGVATIVRMAWAIASTSTRADRTVESRSSEGAVESRSSEGAVEGEPHDYGVACVSINRLDEYISNEPQYGLVGVRPRKSVVEYRPPLRAILEKVGARPGQGVCSMFTFGEASMAVEATIAAFGIPLAKVSPSVWKPKIGAPAEKRLSLARASQLMPACAHFWARQKDDGRAEAAMLALYDVFSRGVVPTSIAPGKLNHEAF